MTIFIQAERRLARLIADIVFANPFLAERVQLERRALGKAYIEVGEVKAIRPEGGENPNTAALLQRSEQLLAAVQKRAAASARPPAGDDLDVIAGLGLFVLYHRYWDRLDQLAQVAEEPAPNTPAPTTSQDARLRVPVPWYRAFSRDFEACLRLAGKPLVPEEDAASLLAFFFQIARAFSNIYTHIVGRSSAATRLRAEVWQSIFTHDLDRYRRVLFARMADVPTLVTGPSGTGKELVARAVGLSGHIRFDARAGAFLIDRSRIFLPINLSALSPTVIESELFGHRRGSFTGALEGRASFLETCTPYGTVFFDELVDIAPTIQVKLLRVLQTREFQRLGELKPRRFEGRLVSATNRDLLAEIRAGNFREDLYWRLCADRIVTPRLAELIDGDGDELEHLSRFVAAGLLGEHADRDRSAAEVRAFAREVAEWVDAHLGLDYPWPGNFRELEQCARAVMIRGFYRPVEGGLGGDDLAATLREGRITADELLRLYCTQVYSQVGTYEGAARRLGLDRRTVRAKVMSSGDAEPGSLSRT